MASINCVFIICPKPKNCFCECVSVCVSPVCDCYPLWHQDDTVLSFLIPPKCSLLYFIPPFLTCISFLSSSSLSFFYRTGLWEETEVGWDPSGFDQVKMIIISCSCLLRMLSLPCEIYEKYLQTNTYNLAIMINKTERAPEQWMNTRLWVFRFAQ